MAPGVVRRLACLDGENLQVVVETRTAGATVRVAIAHADVGSVSPVQVRGRVHRFLVPMRTLLQDTTWERLRISITVGQVALVVADRPTSALLDGPAVARGGVWLSTAVDGGVASVVRNVAPPRVRLDRATSTASGISLALPPGVTAVTLTRSRDELTRSFPASAGIVDLPLGDLAERGWDQPDYWRATCGTERDVPLVAPDDNIRNVHIAYNFPMYIVRDHEDGLVYYAKPHFATSDRALTVRTGIRAEPSTGGSR